MRTKSMKRHYSLQEMGKKHYNGTVSYRRYHLNKEINATFNSTIPKVPKSRAQLLIYLSHGVYAQDSPHDPSQPSEDGVDKYH